jgi:hypothetical protein
MNESITLTKEDLTEILKITGYWNGMYGTSPKFYHSFLKGSIAYVPNVDKEYYRKILSMTSTHASGTVGSDCIEFVSLFDNKVSLPEAFTIFRLGKNYYGRKEDKATYKELISYISNKVGEKKLYGMFENFLFHYGSSANSFILSQWYELSKINPSFVDVDKAEKIIEKHLLTKAHNTSDKNLGLKLLVFLNNFKDNKEAISSYIETNQDDALFLKGIQKILGKIKNITWQEEETPVVKSKTIVGTITINPESMIKKYGLTRGESEKFFSNGLLFLATKFKELSLNSTSNELHIYATDVDDYKKKEDQTYDKINQLTLLAPHWKVLKDKKDSQTFFENYFETVKMHKDLTDELNKNTKEEFNKKRSKI